MLAISLIIGTTICYAHSVPFVVRQRGTHLAGNQLKLLLFFFVVPFIVRLNSGQCYVDEHEICMLIRVVFSIKAEEVSNIKRLSSLYMFARKKLRSIGSL